MSDPDGKEYTDAAVGVGAVDAVFKAIERIVGTKFVLDNFTVQVCALPCLALPCLALPCLALPCLALPCLALPCLALPCLALPCVAMWRMARASYLSIALGLGLGWVCVWLGTVWGRA
jgi:hypothetical protein